MTAIVCIFKFLGDFWVGGFSGFVCLFLRDLCIFLVLFGKKVGETPGLKQLEP